MPPTSLWGIGNTGATRYMGFLSLPAILIGFVAGANYFAALALRPVSGSAITIFDKKKLMIIVYMSGIVLNSCYALFPIPGNVGRCSVHA